MKKFIFLFLLTPAFSIAQPKSQDRIRARLRSGFCNRMSLVSEQFKTEEKLATEIKNRQAEVFNRNQIMSKSARCDPKILKEMKDLFYRMRDLAYGPMDPRQYVVLPEIVIDCRTEFNSYAWNESDTVVLHVDRLKALKEKSVGAVAFTLAHELAHSILAHSYVREFRKKPLSAAKELEADHLAHDVTALAGFDAKKAGADFISVHKDLVGEPKPLSSLPYPTWAERKKYLDEIDPNEERYSFSKDIGCGEPPQSPSAPTATQLREVTAPVKPQQ